MSNNNAAIFAVSFEQATPLRSGHQFPSEVDGATYLATAVHLNPKMLGDTYSFSTVKGTRVLAAAGAKDWVFVAHEFGDAEVHPAYIGMTYQENYGDSGLSDAAIAEDRVEVLLAKAMVAGLPVNRLVGLLDAFDAAPVAKVKKWQSELGEIYSLLSITVDEFDDGDELVINPKADDRRFV